MKNTNSAAESGAFIRKTRGYSVVQNEALFNDSLSMSAKGLYALIAARIDYTAVPLTKQWLMNHCTEGERSFNRAWDLLKNNGYLVGFRQIGVTDVSLCIVINQIHTVPTVI